jgi:hypothetical protein
MARSMQRPPRSSERSVQHDKHPSVLRPWQSRKDDDATAARQESAPSRLAADHRLRLGVGGLGSIPSWLLVPVAFVVLVTLRFASLVLGTTKPEAKRTKKRRVAPMVHVKSILSISVETAWALGTSMLAGLPLLT